MEKKTSSLNEKETLVEEIERLVEGQPEASEADTAWFWDDEEEDAVWSDVFNKSKK